MTDLNVVTGAFGYTGKYITRRLLASGEQVKTLTGHPDRHDPFDGQVEAMPFHFDNPVALAESLRGVKTLYVTYWIRFEHGKMTFDKAVSNTKVLIDAASEAGVKRFVYVSIANPSADSPLPYYAGKAELEAAIIQSGLSYAILRPTVIFSLEDILINNIVWLLRHLPVFGVPGDGQYGIQPIFVEDMAALAVEAGQGRENVVLDAVGPEMYTFEELVALLKENTGSRAAIVHLPPAVALVASRVVGAFVGDVVLTADEVKGLMGNLLISEGPPTGETRLSVWLDEHADRLGVRYASELARHYRHKVRREA